MTRRRSWNGEGESRARADGAFGDDAAAVGLDDLLHDGEAEASSSAGGIGGMLVEDLGQHLGRNPRAVIADGALDGSSRNFPRADDHTAAGCIFEGVAEQILEDLREQTSVGPGGQEPRDLICHLDLFFRGNGAKIEDQALNEGPELKGAEFRLEGAAGTVGVKQLTLHSFQQGGDAANIAGEQFKEVARLGERLRGEAVLDLLSDEGNGVQRGAEIVRQKGQMFILLLFAHESLLGSESHDRQPDPLIDPVIDDERRAADEVEAVTLGDGGKSDAEQIVLGDDFTHIESIVKALHAVNGRTAAGLLGGDGAVAIELEIACDLRHEIGQMIGKSELAEISLPEKVGRLEAPFGDDLCLSLGEDLCELGERRVFEVHVEEDFRGEDSGRQDGAPPRGGTEMGRSGGLFPVESAFTDV